MTSIPAKPTLDGLEAKWDAQWQESATYRFDRTKERAEIYAVDTPPPTVSGSLHLGSMFGYVQVDALVRFQRMAGKEVFYPMGWDDNGLPTERRVQNHFGVRCDPTLPYEPDAEFPEGADGHRLISRQNFLELCRRQTAIDEQQFEDVWRTVGLSVDWDLNYTTINERSRRVAQRAFLRNLDRGEAYSAEAPTMWDVDFQTAVAQAELEERETQGAYHRIRFLKPDGDGVEIETTRPELLPSCVALVAHPDDARYQPLFGTEVVTPLFGVSVPVVAHELADPEKGSGIAMVCTFGDNVDVTWWRHFELPVRAVIQRNGRFQRDRPSWLDEATDEVWAQIAGLRPKQVRRKLVELLTGSGDLIGEPRPITHEVKYFEKGDQPLEIVTSRQWYITNGAREPKRRDALIEGGKAIHWHPDFMRIRLEHWVEGLNTDWLVSRQRYFGVPFPVWYPVDADGQPDWDQPILAAEDTLPVDPLSEVPPGFTEAQRNQPGGFTGDPDVMDTWATSSLTPQIAGGWGDDDDLFQRVFPMDLRPQGPEIIRTWLFSTLLRSQLEHDVVPWRHASINGWILDPDRKKMSKSKGNVITPMGLIEEHGADGVRYWACQSASGVDTAVDYAQMKVGRRLAIKLLNATRFVLGLGVDAATAVDGAATITDPLDRAMLSELAKVVDECTKAFTAYEYHRSLQRTEAFFWRFCDDYLELVKSRAYSDQAGAASAVAALALALSTVQRLFAPFVPFVAEEVWSWWQEGSVHRQPWPDAGALLAASAGADGTPFDMAAAVLYEIRKAKSSENRSMRTEVTMLRIEATPEQLAVLDLVLGDVREAGVVTELETSEGPDLSVKAELAAPQPKAPKPTA